MPGVLRLVVAVSVLTESAALLHGVTGKLENPSRQELRSRASISALSLNRSRVQIQQAPGSDKKKWQYAPRMFVAEGCDGSTAIMIHAAQILDLHGIHTGDPKAQKELLDVERNPYFLESHGEIVTAMKRMSEDRNQVGETLLFKSILHRDANATISSGLRELGTYAVYNTRRNLVDHLACMIRDCFLNTPHQWEQYGYPVDSNGHPSRVCFDRRKTPGADDKAYIKIKYLADNLKFYEEQAINGMEMLVGAGYAAEHTTTEAMIAFESGSFWIQESMDAWTKLLSSWGVKADEVVLRKYLTERAGTYSQPPQKEAVFNVVEVHEELRRLGRADLIRVE